GGVEEGSLLHPGALLEMEPLQEAGYPRPSLDVLGAVQLADPVGGDRRVALNHPDDRHLERGGCGRGRGLLASGGERGDGDDGRDQPVPGPHGLLLGSKWLNYTRFTRSPCGFLVEVWGGASYL